MSDFWKNKNVLITGGAGFLGSHLVDILRTRGCDKITVPRKATCDLVEKENICRILDESKPQIIIHLAAIVGGIRANQLSPGSFFYENLTMGAGLVHEAYLRNVEKFVTIGTVCAYPKFTETPFKEDDLWKGYPEETNAPYGLAKKMLLVQMQAYRKQYGFNGIYLLPTNLYGPRDNFDPVSSHVIPALIKKCFDAIDNGDNSISIWGDGSATRDFCYVEDTAQAIILAAEHYDGAEPVNIGSGIEISIKELAHIITELTGFRGEITWDTSKPNGQPRRLLDTSRAKEYFGFEATTDFAKGLEQTIDWYKKTFR